MQITASTALVLTEQSEKRTSSKAGSVRKMSEDSSIYEVSSLEYEDEAKEFLAV